MLYFVLSWLLKIAVVAFLGWLVWKAMRPRHALKIVVDENGVQSSSGLPLAQKRKVREFLENDVQIERRIIILGDRGRDGAMRLQFRGRIHPSVQQQIRNFLVLNL